MKVNRAVLILVVAIWAGTATADRDSASARITLTIPPLVSISHLDDIQLGSWSGQGDLAEMQTVCVWSSSKEYSITASSSASHSQSFALTAEHGAPIPYQVFWNDGFSTQQLEPEQRLHGISSTAANRDCSDGAEGMAGLTVRVPEASLQAAPPGDYHDTLVLTIASE
jgi:hypothetical protein